MSLSLFLFLLAGLSRNPIAESISIPQNPNLKPVHGPVIAVTTEWIAFPGKFADWVSGPTVLVSVVPISSTPSAQKLTGIIYEKQTASFYQNDTLREEILYLGDGAVKQRTLYTHDEQGRCTHLIGFNANQDEIHKESYQYDSVGNLTEKNTYRSDHLLEERSILSYDGQGKLSEWEQYTTQGFQQKTQFNYDFSDNHIEALRLKPDGTPVLKHILIPDEKGNIREYRLMKPDDTPVSRWEYTLDDYGQKIAEALYIFPKGLDFQQSFSYDEKGNRTSWSSIGSKGDWIRNEKYTYQYDGYGNWIQKISYICVLQSGRSYYKPDRGEYREIKYR